MDYGNYDVRREPPLLDSGSYKSTIGIIGIFTGNAMPVVRSWRGAGTDDVGAKGRSAQSGPPWDEHFLSFVPSNPNRFRKSFSAPPSLSALLGGELFTEIPLYLRNFSA